MEEELEMGIQSVDNLSSTPQLVWRCLILGSNRERSLKSQCIRPSKRRLLQGLRLEQQHKRMFLVHHDKAAVKMAKIRQKVHVPIQTELEVIDDMLWQLLI